MPLPAKSHGLIFATDSRYTFQNRPHHDFGRKLYAIGTNTGLVFSGHARTAQRARHWFERYLHQAGARPLPPERALSDFARLLNVSRYQKANPRQHTTMAVGIRTAGESFLGLFSTHRDAPSLIGPGIAPIGNKAAAMAFWSAFREAEREAWLRGSPPSDIETGSLLIAGAVAQAIQVADPAGSVGGGIQLLIFDRAGPYEARIGLLDPGSTMAEAKWTQVTIPLAEVHADGPAPP